MGSRWNSLPLFWTLMQLRGPRTKHITRSDRNYDDPNNDSFYNNYWRMDWANKPIHGIQGIFSEIRLSIVLQHFLYYQCSYVLFNLLILEILDQILHNSTFILKKIIWLYFCEYLNLQYNQKTITSEATLFVDIIKSNFCILHYLKTKVKMLTKKFHRNILILWNSKFRMIFGYTIFERFI